MYNNSDSESVSFRSELSATVSTMNSYYARQNSTTTTNSNSAPPNPRPVSAAGNAPNRPPSAASVASSSGAASQTQSLPRRKSRNGRHQRSGRNSRRSSRNPSVDRPSTLELSKQTAPIGVAHSEATPAPSPPPPPPPMRSSAADCRVSEHNGAAFTRPAWYDPPTGCAPATVQLVRQLERIEPALHAMQITGEYLTDAERYARLRGDALDTFAQLLAQDVRFAHDHQLEAHMWKHLFYTQVEAVKKRLAAAAAAAAAAATGQQQQQQPDEQLPAAKEACVLLVDDGLAALEHGLHRLEEQFDYRLERFLDEYAGASKRAVGTMRIALVVSEALLLHLGDLARYREQLVGTKNFGRAKQWYTKAQHLMPTNGKPFNALATIAIQTVSGAVLGGGIVCFTLRRNSETLLNMRKQIKNVKLK